MVIVVSTGVSSVLTATEMTSVVPDSSLVHSIASVLSSEVASISVVPDVTQRQQQSNSGSGLIHTSISMSNTHGRFCAHSLQLKSRLALHSVLGPMAPLLHSQKKRQSAWSAQRAPSSHGSGMLSHVPFQEITKKHTYKLKDFQKCNLYDLFDFETN